MSEGVTVVSSSMH